MAASDAVTPNLYSDTLEAPRSECQAISRTLFRRVMAFSEGSADFVTCAGGIFAANSLYFSLHIGKHIHYPTRQVASVAIVVGVLSVFILRRDGAYRGGGSMLQIRETERALRIPAQSLILLLPFSFFLNLYFSRAAFLIAVLLLPPLLIIQKQLFVFIIRLLHVRGYGVDRVVVYGAGDAGKRVVETLLYSPRLGLSPVAIIDDDSTTDEGAVLKQDSGRCRSIPLDHGPVTSKLLHLLKCDLLIVAIPNLPTGRQAAAVAAAKQAGVRIAFLHGPAVQEWQWTESIDIDGLLLTSVGDPIASWRYAVVKRTADLILSSLLLLLLAPLLFLIALLIRRDSPGPAILVQKRVGRNEQIFDMYKFRTMLAGSPKYCMSPTTPRDPRITRFGRVLRRTSLDELPQLMNVLLGDMSMVGPRPEMPFIVRRYSARHRQRHQVIPGITGLWQLSTDRAHQIHENIQYDLYYIRNRTFFMDMAILIHTLFLAMHGI
jgi:exopolysaccharide biosynthesis polyprenyl glycosylphosphotransferase